MFSFFFLAVVFLLILRNAALSLFFFKKNRSTHVGSFFLFSLRFRMPKRTRSGDTDPKYLRKVEVHPDISLELSRLPSVRKLIEENNAQTKPRFRLKVSDFCNEAILTLAKGENGPSDVFVFLNEMEENLKYTPRVSSITKILYLWNSTPSRVADAVKLIRRTLDSASGGGGASSTDESFVTVSLRVITNCETPDEGLITRVLSSLPKENYKRRLFHPLFEFGREHHNVEFAFSMLKIAVEANVELWDVDYHILLQTVVERSEVQGKVKSAIELLNMMALHHPVMGRLNAEMIQTIVGGTVVRISEDGHCGGCAQRLRSFDLSQEERAVLVRDVVEKLVTPRVICQSHYEPLVEVTEEEQTARWGIFNTFVTSMEHNDYDTLIDGANLGYYGLNSWYSEAKVELLKRKGVDPATVPLKERNNVPFPVDVPPKFETIEHARKSAATRGRKPLIILHERHIREAIGTNQTILEQWKELNCVLASPHFLNDDYCWLYGSLKNPERGSSPMTK
ncbi:hypothetical protein AGDE_04666 [Angomonas deanei]|nr:hypothetical protein AGDE_04666 [Angomonas deanei]|eukprot:EPY39262.1 hypothetical protein AGDE_04666 [Angomonas deanei]